MPDKTIDDVWSEFWSWTQNHPAGSFVFRGQADASPIKPKIGRSGYNYEIARERTLFDAFERAARPFLRSAMSRFELLALAQHHGAPTRLVDWSTTPLVAAWFAVSSYPADQDARIYALDVTRPDLDTVDTRSGLSGSGSRIEDPLLLTEGVFIMETAQVSNRMTTQRGIFTLHGNPTMALDIKSDHVLTIPDGVRTEFQSRLMDLGVDAAYIFPDIDGLCRTLDWKFRTGKALSAVA